MIELENEELKVCFDPDFGCKIHSFFLKKAGFELAAKNEGSTSYFSDTRTVSFGDYAFGMDDAFPSIDKETLTIDGKKYEYPDHGMVWNHPFKVIDVQRNSAECSFYDEEYALFYKKKLSLNGDTLSVFIEIDYEGEKPFPCIWTFHGLIQYEDGIKITLPKGSDRLINVLNHEVFGKEGKILTSDEVKMVTSKLPKKDSGDMVKYYVDGPVKEGECRVTYTTKGVEYILTYDAKTLPFLGVWITAGGLDGANNMALEPSDGFYDSISNAEKNKAVSVLKPGEKRLINFDIRLRRVLEDKDE